MNEQRNANFKLGSEQFTEYATTSNSVFKKDQGEEGKQNSPQRQQRNKAPAASTSSPEGSRRSHFTIGSERDREKTLQSMSQSAFNKDVAGGTLFGR